MAIPLARPRDESFDRVMAKIDELGLNEHIVELETKGYTTLKGVLSGEQIDRARSAILDRVERNIGSRIDLDTATERDFEGMTYVPYLLYD